MLLYLAYFDNVNVLVQYTDSITWKNTSGVCKVWFFKQVVFMCGWSLEHIIDSSYCF